ncbi:MAG: serine protease [Bacteroidales bacterium]|nr:serine protease [Bacteroidales bacterium]
MKISVPVLCFVSFVLFSGCSGKKEITGKLTVDRPTYSSGFPNDEVSASLEQITRSVKKVYSVSYYTTYKFRSDSKITSFHLKNGSFKDAAWGIVSTSETAFGSGTVVAAGHARVALLTCAHIVSSPDTLITRFDPVDGIPSGYIRSISVREKQENWVKDFSGCGSFTVLASDENTDLAILGKNCEVPVDTIATLTCPLGHSRELRWGNFVYVFGFPMGNLVITSGLVSPAPKRPMGEFSVDALLNKGFSGGILVARRTTGNCFEMVGLVKTVSSSRENMLRPDSGANTDLDWIPYTGRIFTGNSDVIHYGLNAVVPSEVIADFYRQHRTEILQCGYNLDAFFKYVTN